MVRHGAASAQRGGVTGWGGGFRRSCGGRNLAAPRCGGPSFLRRQEPRSPAVGGIRRSSGGRNLAALGLEDGAPIITPSQYPHTQPLHRALARLDSSLRWNDEGRERGARFQLTLERRGQGTGGEVPAYAGTTGAGNGGEVPASAGTTGAGNGGEVPASAGTTGATTGRCPHRGPATQCSLRRSNGPSTHASIS